MLDLEGPRHWHVCNVVGGERSTITARSINMFYIFIRFSSIYPSIDLISSSLYMRSARSAGKQEMLYLVLCKKSSRRLPRARHGKYCQKAVGLWPQLHTMVFPLGA